MFKKAIQSTFESLIEIDISFSLYLGFSEGKKLGGGNIAACAPKGLAGGGEII